MNELPALPMSLYPSRTKLALLLIICLTFTAIGVLMLRDGDRAGYFCGGFFALGIPIFLFSMSRKAAYLRLEAEGFTFCSLYRSHTVRWADVQEFGILVIRGKRMVAWNFATSYTVSRRLRDINQMIANFDAALPDTYGMKAPLLVELMAAPRDRYSANRGESANPFHLDFHTARKSGWDELS